MTKPPPSPSPPPRGLLTQQKDREPSGLSKQAIRRFGGYSAVKVWFARGDSEAKTHDVDSVIKTCHISFNGKSDLELSEALSSCHCSLDVRDFSPLSLSEFAQAAGVEALGKKQRLFVFISPCHFSTGEVLVFRSNRLLYLLKNILCKKNKQFLKTEGKFILMNKHISTCK